MKYFITSLILIFIFSHQIEGKNSTNVFVNIDIDTSIVGKRQKELNDCKKTILQLKDDLQKLNDKCSNTNPNNSDCTNEINAIQIDLNECRDRIDTFQNRLYIERNRNNQLQNVITIQNLQIKNLQTNLDTCNSRVKRLEEKVRMLILERDLYKERTEVLTDTIRDILKDEEILLNLFNNSCMEVRGEYNLFFSRRDVNIYMYPKDIKVGRLRNINVKVCFGIIIDEQNPPSPNADPVYFTLTPEFNSKDLEIKIKQETDQHGVYGLVFYKGEITYRVTTNEFCYHRLKNRKNRRERKGKSVNYDDVLLIKKRESYNINIKYQENDIKDFDFETF